MNGKIRLCANKIQESAWRSGIFHIIYVQEEKSVPPFYGMIWNS